MASPSTSVAESVKTLVTPLLALTGPVIVGALGFVFTGHIASAGAATEQTPAQSYVPEFVIPQIFTGLQGCPENGTHAALIVTVAGEVALVEPKQVSVYVVLVKGLTGTLFDVTGAPPFKAPTEGNILAGAAGLQL